MTVITPATSATTSPAPAFDRWLDDVLAFHYRRNPVTATFTGIHDHDQLLPDYSPAANAAAEARMSELLADLDGLPDEPLDEARRHDRALAEGALRLWLWEHGSQHFQLGNPSFYTGEAVFAVMSLFHRDSEPVAERAAAAEARMRALPTFLAQARTNVSAAPKAWTERAIREARSGVAYFGEGFGLLMDERGIRTDALEQAAGIAADALREHLTWLEGTLSGNTNDHYSAGREAFDRYLHLGHQLPRDKDAGWVERFARDQLALATAELERRAAETDPSRDWRQQLAALADDHPSIGDYYGAYTTTWEAARRAGIDANLVTWPDFPIEYGPFPKSDRAAAAGLYYLFYRCPAPLGRPETHYYRVTPIEPDMPEDEQTAKLRATNHAVIKLNHVIHHGGLGHHVQNWNGFRADSRIGRLAAVDAASRLAWFCAGTLVEGWACYATELMGEQTDFLTLAEALSEAQGRVRMCCRAIADVGIHTGAMTLEDAAAFYEREAGMTAAASMGEAVKNSMFPGAAMMYLVGLTGIYDLRAELMDREGDDFSLRRFHDRFLSYGAIPVSLIAASMTA
ncbi:MAG TPA: DUF885 family protein [Thermomicrobiales bacterium]|jgi:uncharacterized protein (DUF885 family)|nr:DUF885 family protein [Thermomicrobiales bacterium]